MLKERGSTYICAKSSFVNTTTQLNSIYDPPVMSATLGRRLFQATTGYITYRTGQWSIFGWGGDVSRKMDRSSVALGLAGATKKGNNFSCELQVKKKMALNVYIYFICFNHCGIRLVLLLLI
jgi:DnaJ family protein C protein 11